MKKKHVVLENTIVGNLKYYITSESPQYLIITCFLKYLV